MAYRHLFQTQIPKNVSILHVSKQISQFTITNTKILQIITNETNYLQTKLNTYDYNVNFDVQLQDIDFFINRCEKYKFLSKSNPCLFVELCEESKQSFMSSMAYDDNDVIQHNTYEFMYDIARNTNIMNKIGYIKVDFSLVLDKNIE